MSVKKLTKGVYVCCVRNTQNYRIIFHIYADMQYELKALSFFVANRYIVPILIIKERVRNQLCNNPYQDVMYNKELHSNSFLLYTGHCRNSYILSEKSIAPAIRPVTPANIELKPGFSNTP